MIDPLVEWMQQHNVPVTREKYIALSWGSDVPEWTPEMEGELPDFLQEGHVTA